MALSSRGATRNRGRGQGIRPGKPADRNGMFRNRNRGKKSCPPAERKAANSMAHARNPYRSAEFIPLQRTNQKVYPNRRSADRTERGSVTRSNAQTTGHPKISSRSRAFAPSSLLLLTESFQLNLPFQPMVHSTDNGEAPKSIPSRRAAPATSPAAGAGPGATSQASWRRDECRRSLRRA